jgi:hypothetical protein
MSLGTPSAMSIQERLTVFDSWLTRRIEEAHDRSKDLAFRDLSPEEQTDGLPWEYSFMEPGARSPQGDGWSVYRFSGVEPQSFGDSEDEGDSSGGGRRSLLGALTDKVLGRGPRDR